MKLKWKKKDNCGFYRYLENKIQTKKEAKAKAKDKPQTQGEKRGKVGGLIKGWLLDKASCKKKKRGV